MVAKIVTPGEPNALRISAAINNHAGLIDGFGTLVETEGVQFPATQVDSADPNTLDDYEEGSWTPTLIGATTPGTHTYAVQIGRYTKVGNVVFVWARITLSALDGTAAGFARVTGLPFTAANVTSFPYPGIVGAVSLVDLAVGYSMFAGQIGVNSDFIAVQQLGDNIANLNVNVTDFQNTSVISFQFCYRV